jgi:hypothetical protein
MRTAQMVKLFAYALIVAGAFLAFKFFSPGSGEFWVVISLSILLWLIVRLLAVAGQLIYEIRNDSSRMLTNIERALYYSNSLTKEIRDLADSEQVKDGA